MLAFDDEFEGRLVAGVSDVGRGIRSDQQPRGAVIALEDRPVKRRRGVDVDGVDVDEALAEDVEHSLLVAVGGGPVQDGVVLVVQLMGVCPVADEPVHGQCFPVLSSEMEGGESLRVAEGDVNLVLGRFEERLKRSDVPAASSPVNGGLFGVRVADHIGAGRSRLGQEIPKGGFSIVERRPVQAVVALVVELFNQVLSTILEKCFDVVDATLGRQQSQPIDGRDLGGFLNRRIDRSLSHRIRRSRNRLRGFENICDTIWTILVHLGRTVG